MSDEDLKVKRADRTLTIEHPVPVCGVYARPYVQKVCQVQNNYFGAPKSCPISQLNKGKGLKDYGPRKILGLVQEKQLWCYHPKKA